ncbi:MAG: transposase [Gammaproteobacteria bacterium]|nr:transposase [Gammaproteobacteria bacterium]
MPRKPRFFVPGIAAHIVQRGNNRQPTFFEEQDYRVYLSLLRAAAKRYRCLIHAYTLMTNHVHILATPIEQTSVSQLMQHLGRHYVPHINRKYGRTGTLWEGRFKASTVESSSYVLACYRYIELNPVRARIVDRPADYPWSSFKRNACLAPDRTIVEHPEYSRLGSSRAKRASNYLQLFEQPLGEDGHSAIRLHTHSGTPLGSKPFREGIDQALSLNTGQPKRGRPSIKGL